MRDLRFSTVFVWLASTGALPNGIASAGGATKARPAPTAAAANRVVIFMFFPLPCLSPTLLGVLLYTNMRYLNPR